MSTKGRLGTALWIIGVSVLLIRLLYKFNEVVSSPDGLEILGIVLLIIGVVASAWLAWVFHKARTFRMLLQQRHPEALVIDTFWTRETGRFLKKGPLSSQAKGTGFILDRVVDARGLQLVRQRRRATYFGLVPWEKVVSVRMETLGNPLFRRPLLVIEIDSWNTPYVAVLRLVPSGRQNRESGMALGEMILAKRHRVSFLEGNA